MQTAKLTDICEIIQGQAPPSSTYNEQGAGTLFVRAGDFGELFPSTKMYTTEPKAFGKKGDIFLCVVGATSGKVNLGIEAAITRSIFALRPKEMVLQRYLFYYLKSEYERLNYLKSGSAQGIISKKTLDRILLPLPSLASQRRIVTVLERADTLRQKREQANLMANKIPQAVFLRMFGDPVSNSENWSTKKLTVVCSQIIGGGTPSKSNPQYYIGNLPWVTPKDMKNLYVDDSIDHINEAALNESSARLVPANSLLMVIRSGILRKRLPVAVNLRPVAINQDMKGFVFREEIVNCNFMLNFFLIYQWTLLKKVRSVTAHNLDFNDVKNIDVILPPIELQNSFSRIVEAVRRIQLRQSNMTTLVLDLFSSLMSKAFNGELLSQPEPEQVPAKEKP